MILLAIYAYVVNSPTNNIDPLGLGTFAIGPQLTANLLAKFDISAQVSISWNSSEFSNLSQWRIGGIFSITPLTQDSTGVGVTGGVLFTISSANNPSAFNGWSAVAGGSFSLGSYAAGLDIGNMGSGCPKTYSAFLGRGMEITGALPGEVHAGVAWTAAGSFSL